MTLPNEQNLIPFNERTESERREIAKKAGVASGEARRKKKSMREAAQMLLSLELKNNKMKSVLQDMGIEEEEMNYQTALLVVALQSGLKGNLGAIELIRDIAGEHEEDEGPQNEGVIIINDIPKSDSG